MLVPLVLVIGAAGADGGTKIVIIAPEPLVDGVDVPYLLIA